MGVLKSMLENSYSGRNYLKITGQSEQATLDIDFYRKNAGSICGFLNDHSPDRFDTDYILNFGFFVGLPRAVKMLYKNPESNFKAVLHEGERFYMNETYLNERFKSMLQGSRSPDLVAGLHNLAMGNAVDGNTIFFLQYVNPPRQIEISYTNRQLGDNTVTKKHIGFSGPECLECIEGLIHGYKNLDFTELKVNGY